jgi:hypothetical protein
MVQKSPLERFVSVDRYGKPDGTTRPAVNVMPAINAQKVPTAPFDQARKFRGRTLASYSNFQDPFFTVIFRFSYLYRQAPFNRLSHIAKKLLHRFAFCGAPRNRRDLCPKATFLRLVHDNFDLHIGLRATKISCR